MIVRRVNTVRAAYTPIVNERDAETVGDTLDAMTAGLRTLCNACDHCGAPGPIWGPCWCRPVG